MSYDFKINTRQEDRLSPHGNGLWTTAQIADLRVLWPTMTATKIGLALGGLEKPFSKSAVIAKAHRLGLPLKAPARPALEGRGERRAAIAASIKLGMTISEIRIKHSCAAHTVTSVRESIGIVSKYSFGVEKRVVTKKTLRPVASVMTATVLPPAPPRPFAVQGACQWPFGEPGTKAFRFCGDAAPRYGVPAPHSYCMHHRSLAYSARRTAWAEAHQ